MAMKARRLRKRASSKLAFSMREDTNLSEGLEALRPGGEEPSRQELQENKRLEREYGRKRMLG